MAAGRNLWETVTVGVRGGPMSLFLFLVGFVAGIVGIILSWEDFVSSYYGIISLQTAFGIQAVSEAWVLYVMAATPWIGQVTFFGLWSLDTKRWWALLVSLVWFALDFLSDVQFRSGETFIPLEGGQMQMTTAIYVSAAMTFLYFTIGAELFVTASSALVVTLFPDAVREVASMRGRMKRGLSDAARTWRDTDRQERQAARPAQPAQPVRAHQERRP